MVTPLSIVKNGIILEIKVWIKLNGFIPNLGNIIKIIPKVINISEIGIIYFRDSYFFLILSKFNIKKHTVREKIKKIIILNI